MTGSIAVAVIGAGAIGRTHVETISRTPGVHLTAIVDPAPGGQALAQSINVPCLPDTSALVESRLAQSAIVATPNETHLPIAAILLRAGLPVLLEKPVAESVESALRLIELVDVTDVPLLVGHHRRYNPVVCAAYEAIQGGALGHLVMGTVTNSLAKPANYFEPVWWRTPGAGGPLLINLVHEIDLLRHFFGEVANVQALVSNERRRFQVEDTAAVCLTFADGGLATLCISDAAVGPWSWDLSAGENPARFPANEVSAHYYAGSRGGLSLPDLRLWKPPGEPDWTCALVPETLPYKPADTYSQQLLHFAELVRKGGQPRVSARDATANIIVLDAIAKAAMMGQTMAVDLSCLSRPCAGKANLGRES
ncbi:Predicted dehydrogenase [Rhizobium tibeticum]|uniref:Inositol 2-dehydrogenase n=1 Tax=Rhizobium tibeticum TaxID=501024 RepID=A0A1H8W083_9HYPH|nr:Gfo/Idh/MocA family oxidoreductase [Rhizobium tibeticum]SEI20086.1 Inositol 2-dehydrogenase [Rhizobium tibeticum]SEP21059.1 Predicted dehydrogenase [Rhizobium tibeticum]